MDYNDHNEQRLERAIAAMRDIPALGDMPATEILDKIAASHDAAPRRPLWIVERIRNMKPSSKLAASLFLTAGLASLVFVLTHASSALAFDAVADQLHRARTLTADMVINAAGHTMDGRVMFSAPAKFRSEMGGVGVSIANMSERRMIALDQAHKVAIVFKLEGDNRGDQANSPIDFIEKLRNVSRDAGKPLGEAQIDGVRAKQFNVTANGQTFIIWADAKTGAPLRVDFSQDVGNQHTTMQLDHLKLDVPLDDALFSTDVPEGYTVQEAPISMTPPSEEDVVKLLRLYSERSGGAFPPTVRDFAKMFEPLFPKPTPGSQSKPDAAFMKLVMQSGRAVAYISKLPKSADWHYAGKDQKAGDASKPIFWYVPTGASHYRVIYGDLHVEDAAPGKVPEDPAAETQTSNP